MGLLDITNLSNLASRTIRREITGNDAGLRQITRGTDTSTWGNFLSNSFTGLGKAIGWALEKVIGPAMSITATTVWGWIVGGTIFLLNFNFAATDQELEQRIVGMETLLAGQLGELTGVTLGWLLCGYAPGVVMLRFNEALALHILKNVNEEALDEILGEIETFLVFVRNYYAQKAFVNLYIAVRALIKNAANGDSDTLAGAIIESFFKDFPGLKKAAQMWGEEGGKSWTIATKIEELIEKIPNEKLREFTENALEAFGESCIEAGYIVASSIDSWNLQQRLNRDQVLGDNRTIEIFPDRSVNEPFREGIILSGRQEVLRTVATQTMATHQQLRHRDVGVIVGEQLQTYIRKVPAMLQLRIYWTNRKDGTTGDVLTYTTINNIDRKKLDWALIKKLAGGDNGRLFGNVTVKGFMNDNSRIVVKVVTESQGVALIKDLAILTDTEIDWTTTNKKLREGNLATYYKDEWIDDSVTVYPLKMVLFNKYRILNQTKQGEVGSRGKIQTREFFIPLWTQNKPPEFDRMIAEILTIPGLNPAEPYNPYGSTFP